VAEREIETTACLRAHALLLEMLFAYEVRQAAHVAMADPEQTALRLADRLAERIDHTDDGTLVGPAGALSPADRAAMAAAIKRQIDRVVKGTISRLAKASSTASPQP
jgi:hypothetical protein